MYFIELKTKDGTRLLLNINTIIAINTTTKTVYASGGKRSGWQLNAASMYHLLSTVGPAIVAAQTTDTPHDKNLEV